MHTLSGRTTALIGAGVATLLLVMQLRSEGAAGYDMGDVLSIVVAVLPVLFHGARVHAPRRPPDRNGDDDRDGPATPAHDHPDAPPGEGGPGGVLQPLVSNAVGWLLAGVSWLLAVVLVVLQAWPAALSAAIIFVVAASAISPAPAAERTPTSAGGHADRR